MSKEWFFVLKKYKEPRVIEKGDKNILEKYNKIGVVNFSFKMDEKGRIREIACLTSLGLRFIRSVGGSVGGEETKEKV